MNNAEMLASKIETFCMVSMKDLKSITYGRDLDMPVSGDKLPKRVFKSEPMFTNSGEARLYPDRTTPEARAHEYANKLIAKRRAMNHTRQGINSNSRYYAEHVMGEGVE